MPFRIPRIRFRPDDRSGRLYYWIDVNAGRLLTIIVFLLLAIWAVTLSHYNLVIGNSAIGLWLTEALVSVGPELAGIAIGVVAIDYLNELRREQERKSILLGMLGSTHRDVVEMAIVELTNRGWLYDGTLKGAILTEANLTNAILHGAYLSEADFFDANLDGAMLDESNMHKCNLMHASLHHTNLSDADLTDASLYGIDLREALLKDTDLKGVRIGHDDQIAGVVVPGEYVSHLQGVNMYCADLQDVNLALVNLEDSLLWGVNLRGGLLAYTNLKNSGLKDADLQNAWLFETKLQGSYIENTQFKGASLIGANLQGATGWTFEQFEETATLEGTIMPDGKQIESKDSLFPVEGLTFEEWKDQYVDVTQG